MSTRHVPLTTRRPRRWIRAAIAVLLLAAVAALVRPSAVLAGTYTVHACQTPTGIYTGMAGWTSAASVAPQGEAAGTATACTDQSRTFSLSFGPDLLSVSPNRSVSWTFAAPPFTQISSFSLFRTLQLGWPVVTNRYGRAYLYDVWHDDDVAENQVEYALPPYGEDTAGIEFPPSVAQQGVSWNSLHVRLSCWAVMGSYDCGPFPAQVTISRAAVGLSDELAPDGLVTGGSLAGSDPVRGTGDLAIHAYDAGGGVYRVALAVDGDEVSRQVLADAGGTCGDVDPGNADAHEFAAAEPCPPNVDGTVHFDTATLRDGTHDIRASVEDAAGNESVVYDGTVETHNAPINSAAPDLSGQASVGGQLTAAPGQWDGAPTGYDHRWLRCDADGASCDPVAGAAGTQYTLTEADAYHRMRVEVTAANDSGASSAQSAPSALVADAAGNTAPQPPTAPGTGGGGTGGGTGGDGGTGGSTSPTPPPGGIQGVQNPLADVAGHVANGSDATAHAHLSVAFQRADGGTVRRVVLRPGRRASIVGRLVDGSGAGIGGARLGAAWRIAGRRWVARPGVRTDPDGRFVYTLPAGPSRDVRFTYFPYSDSRAVELSNVVRADALAPLSIRADRRHVTGARVVRLSGRVGGGAIPRGGLLVTLEGWQRGWGWRVFRTVRTDRSGRWSTSYRFRLASGRFGFRVLVPHQGTFPYATSRSAGVFVVVS